MSISVYDANGFFFLLFVTLNPGTSYREYLTKMWWIFEIFVIKRMPIGCRSVTKVRCFLILILHLLHVRNHQFHEVEVDLVFGAVRTLNCRS